MPLSRPPVVWLAFRHQPPHATQRATPHTPPPEMARTTANPTVGPSRRLGLPPVTGATLDTRPVGSAGSPGRSPLVAGKRVARSYYFSLKARMRSLNAALSRA